MYNDTKGICMSIRQIRIGDGGGRDEIYFDA